MGLLSVTSITDLSADLVTQTQAELAQLMQEQYPEIELTRGAVHDLLTYFGGVFGAWEQTELQRYLNARSLLQIETDPTLADPALVDNIFSMFDITRKTGDFASGEAVVVILTDDPTVIPTGFAFTANGLSFAAQQSYPVVPAESPLITDQSRIINPLGDGTYAFTVPLTCATAGPTGNISRNTKMVPDTLPANFVTAYAAGDFTGGVLDETNAQILTRLQEGVAAKTLSSATNIRALIKAQSRFQNTLDYSIVGFGNPEMTRDQHTIFPGSFGGRIDVYARTRELPLAITLEKEATLVSVTVAGGIWQFSLGRDECPGFYDVVQILRPSDPPDNAGFAVVLDQRTMDLSAGTTLTPDILYIEEGTYSRHQTAIIRFLDTDTSTRGLAVGARAIYSVGVRGMPLLDELQDFLADSTVRYRAGDILVRGAIPCYLTVNFEIRQARGVAVPDTEAIKNALADMVNRLGFPGQLFASQISEVAATFLAGRQALGPIDMQGRIRRPNGENHFLRSTTVLQIPHDPGHYVTGSTTAFILDPNDIGIAVVTEGYTDDI